MDREDLEDEGVCGLSISEAKSSRREGVCGKSSLATFVGDDDLDGSIGKGTAKSLGAFLVGDNLDGDEGMMGNFCIAAPLFGDWEARVLVKADCLLVVGREGMSARGMAGTDSASLWSCTSIKHGLRRKKLSTNLSPAF